MEAYLQKYNLKKKDIKSRVSDSHIGDISRSYCHKWKELYPHLHLKLIDVHNAVHDGYDEEEKKTSFFNTWRARRGDDATYEELIGALIKIEEEDDAKNICQLLAKSLGKWSSQGKIMLLCRYIYY